SRGRRRLGARAVGRRRHAPRRRLRPVRGRRRGDGAGRARQRGRRCAVLGRSRRRALLRPRHPIARPDLQGGRAMTTQTQHPQAGPSAGGPSAGARSAAPSQRLSGCRGAWLVAEREITTKLRSKAFLVSTGVLLLLVLGSVLFSGFMANTGGFGGATKVAAVRAAERAVAPLDGHGFEVSSATDRAEAERLVLDGEVEAAVVPGGDTAVDMTVLAKDSPPVEIVQALSAAPQVELLAPTTDNPFLA